MMTIRKHTLTAEAIAADPVRAMTGDEIRALIDENERLREANSQLREAAEIFRDFGEFHHLYRKYDLDQLKTAYKILSTRASDEP